MNLIIRYIQTYNALYGQEIIVLFHIDEGLQFVLPPIALHSQVIK